MARDRAATQKKRLAQVVPHYKRMHAGEGTREEGNMYAAEELTYGIAHAEAKRKRSSRDSLAGACAGVKSRQYNLARPLDGQLQWAGLPGLAAFSPLPEHCRSLNPTEYRYVVPCTP